MNKAQQASVELRAMDELAAQDSPMHRLSPLSKLFVTVLYIVVTVSFHKYDISGVFVMVLFPLVGYQVSMIPVHTCFHKLRVVMPLVCAVGLFNPFFDKQIVLYLGNIKSFVLAVCGKQRLFIHTDTIVDIIHVRCRIFLVIQHKFSAIHNNIALIKPVVIAKNAHKSPCSLLLTPLIAIQCLCIIYIHKGITINKEKIILKKVKSPPYRSARSEKLFSVIAVTYGYITAAAVPVVFLDHIGPVSDKKQEFLKSPCSKKFQLIIKKRLAAYFDKRLRTFFCVFLQSGTESPHKYHNLNICGTCHRTLEPSFSNLNLTSLIPVFLMASRSLALSLT